MITQKKMDEIFINKLENIIHTCNLMSPDNMAYYISSIKGPCQEMINYYKENLTSPWHSFIEGDIPPYNKTCLFNCDGIIYIGFVRGDNSLYLEYNLEIHLNINDIDYWMEIPELPKEE